MFEQHGLELSRSNAEALVLDHFLLAIDYIEIALVIDPADVSCIQPSVPQNTGGLFRCVPVSLHDLRTADDNFADFRGTQGDFTGLQVHNPMLGAGHKDAAAFELDETALERAVMRSWRRLRESISLDQGGAHTLLHSSGDVRGQRRGGAEDVLDCAELRWPETFRVGDHKQNGRYSEQPGD